MSYRNKYGGLVNEDKWGPNSFKPRHLPNVKGGRWYIRRERPGVSRKPWRAYSKGKSARFNRHFETFEEAINHAQLVAWAFNNPSPANIRRMIETVMPNISQMAVADNVVRYADFRFQKPRKD